VFTESRVDGIPYTVVTSVYSVCYAELPEIPRNYTEFCATDRVSKEFWNSAEDGILCGSNFHYAELTTIIRGIPRNESHFRMKLRLPQNSKKSLPWTPYPWHGIPYNSVEFSVIPYNIWKIQKEQQYMESVNTEFRGHLK
jgi:hypothetical protein